MRSNCVLRIPRLDESLRRGEMLHEGRQHQGTWEAERMSVRQEKTHPRSTQQELVGSGCRGCCEKVAQVKPFDLGL